MNLLKELPFCGFIPRLYAQLVLLQPTKYQVLFDEDMTDPQLIDYTKCIEVKIRNDVLSDYYKMFWGEGGV